MRTIARSQAESLSEPSLHDYLRALRRLFLIEDQENWKPALRSRVRLAATPKRHLADPSLAVAALGASVERLLGPQIELAGLLFESQVIHDLRVYAQPHRAGVRFYRDNKGLEVDAVIEAANGRWIAVEVKLGHHRVDEGAENPRACGGRIGLRWVGVMRTFPRPPVGRQYCGGTRTGRYTAGMRAFSGVVRQAAERLP